LWLAPGKSVLAAVGLLEANLGPAAISEIFYGPSLATMFNPGGLPPLDPRTPDIIVQPNIGAIYSTSSKKQAEHGGFAFDDTNVMLLVSNPSIKAKTVTSFVETMQVAPTILQALGLDPELDAVQKRRHAGFAGVDLPAAGTVDAVAAGGGFGSRLYSISSKIESPLERLLH
jgi:hypothetical protein